MVMGLHTTWCHVSDMDRSIAFYRDVLGLKPAILSAYWSQFDLGNGQIGLHPMMEGASAPLGVVGKGWYLGIQVEDVRVLKARLIDSGTAVPGDYHDIPGGVIITFGDPDGNPIQAIQMGVTTKDF